VLKEVCVSGEGAAAELEGSARPILGYRESDRDRTGPSPRHGQRMMIAASGWGQVKSLAGP